MKTNRPMFRRRNYFVHRKIQLRFLGLLLLQMSLILTVLAVASYSHVSRIADIAVSAPVLNEQSRLLLTQDLIDHVQVFYTRSLVLLAVTTLVLLLFGILASHRLAGPVIKLERYLSALSTGDLSQRIAFRRNDHLDDFAQEINGAIESLENRRRSLRETAAQLLRCSGDLELGVVERRRAFAEMQAHVASLRETL